MTNGVDSPKGPGEILESATTPQFIPAQPELFLPILDKGVNGIMIEHAKPPYRRGRAGDGPFCCRRYRPHPTFAKTTLPGSGRLVR